MPDPKQSLQKSLEAQRKMLEEERKRKAAQSAG
jgi:hypothetical protein